MDALRQHFEHSNRRLKAYCLNLHVEGQFDYRLDPNQAKFELLYDKILLLASADFGIWKCHLDVQGSIGRYTGNFPSARILMWLISD